MPDDQPSPGGFGRWLFLRERCRNLRAFRWQSRPIHKFPPQPDGSGAGRVLDSLPEAKGECVPRARTKIESERKCGCRKSLALRLASRARACSFHDGPIPACPGESERLCPPAGLAAETPWPRAPATRPQRKTAARLDSTIRNSRCRPGLRRATAPGRGRLQYEGISDQVFAGGLL